MGHKLTGCRNGRQCACGALAADGTEPVREVPVPGALAAPQDAPPSRHRITSRASSR